VKPLAEHFAVFYMVEHKRVERVLCVDRTVLQSSGARSCNNALCYNDHS